MADARFLGIPDKFSHVSDGNSFLKQDSHERMAEAVRMAASRPTARRVRTLFETCIAPDICQLLHGETDPTTEDKCAVLLLPRF